MIVGQDIYKERKEGRKGENLRVDIEWIKQRVGLKKKGKNYKIFLPYFLPYLLFVTTTHHPYLLLLIKLQKVGLNPNLLRNFNHFMLLKAIIRSFQLIKQLPGTLTHTNEPLLPITLHLVSNDIVLPIDIKPNQVRPNNSPGNSTLAW